MTPRRSSFSASRALPRVSTCTSTPSATWFSASLRTCRASPPSTTGGYSQDRIRTRIRLWRLPAAGCEQRHAGERQPGVGEVRLGRLLEPPLELRRGLRIHRAQHRRQRPREVADPRGPLLDGVRVQRHRDLIDFGPAQYRRERLRAVQRERPRDAWRRDLHADLLADRIEHEAEPRVALARAPDRDRPAPTGPQDALDLAHRARG